MGVTRHQVSTNRTGTHRIVRVLLFDTLAEMHEAHTRRWPDDPTDVRAIEAMFVPPADWDDRDPNPYQGQVWLALDQVTMTAIVHEATHAALHLAFVDALRDHSRASTFVNGHHELIPYLIGDLSSAIGLLVNRRLVADGLSLDLGNARYYTEPAHPAVLPRHAEG